MVAETTSLGLPIVSISQLLNNPAIDLSLSVHDPNEVGFGLKSQMMRQIRRRLGSTMILAAQTPDQSCYSTNVLGGPSRCAVSMLNSFRFKAANSMDIGSRGLGKSIVSSPAIPTPPGVIASTRLPRKI